MGRPVSAQGAPIHRLHQVVYWGLAANFDFDQNELLPIPGPNPDVVRESLASSAANRNVESPFDFPFVSQSLL